MNKKVRYSQEKWIKCEKNVENIKNVEKNALNVKKCEKYKLKKLYVQYFHIRKTIPQLKYFT